MSTTVAPVFTCARCGTEIVLRPIEGGMAWVHLTWPDRHHDFHVARPS